MEQHAFTLVLNLNETLVYSDWKYVDPVVERLDGEQCIRCRLSRSATKYQDGKHYRDHSGHDRNPGKLIYISGHTLELCLQQENCVQIKPWKLEVDDTTLLDLIPFLECEDFALLPKLDQRQIKIYHQFTHLRLVLLCVSCCHKTTTGYWISVSILRRKIHS
ncbi:hypothetical protein CRG98_002116 [Punica granatum]|uniref:Mitochondrial import inner membrane translocase subunit TIM50 n=1 Tax=Punica granatum TaxID=22663 RepID=A0A2I0LA24_PUNGR|nr:hypothetical protein CRG98_002116 [Punica granatum]